MTADQIKAILQTPASLFVLMLIASVLNAYKQKAGTGVGIGEYFAHLPETVAMLLTNTICFAVLILTDQLNYASALGLGYASNSLADLVRSGGRSATVSNSTTNVEEKK